MTADEYLNGSRLFRRLKSGPDGQLVEVYAARLAQDGLARHGTWRCLNLVGDLLSWIAGRRSKLTDLDERMVERYIRCRGGKQSIQPGDRAALKRWLSVLRDAGTIAPAAMRPITSQDQIFEEFGDYLRRERGLAPKSIVRHQPFIRRFANEPASALTTACSPSSRRCERPDYAECNRNDARSTARKFAKTAHCCKAVRHSSAGGINGENERHRSSSYWPTFSPASLSTWLTGSTICCLGTGNCFARALARRPNTPRLTRRDREAAVLTEC